MDANKNLLFIDLAKKTNLIIEQDDELLAGEHSVGDITEFAKAVYDYGRLQGVLDLKAVLSIDQAPLNPKEQTQSIPQHNSNWQDSACAKCSGAEAQKSDTYFALGDSFSKAISAKNEQIARLMDRVSELEVQIYGSR